jgi:hypothetical protein
VSGEYGGCRSSGGKVGEGEEGKEKKGRENSGGKGRRS